ncbi:hypothetical protein U8527_05330 [Kordia algicida OT-1]|uniref:Uncharacterized protein n=1 Tax=Kordia algicida OT-1 TaxID=391587 RepID=A9DMM9_9FLAO|nr:hypothetical protein [Kordia algicida]EDP97746.1 hypothetical protein KAOT1_21327 [Kordia algicida OT-1]
MLKKSILLFLGSLLLLQCKSDFTVEYIKKNSDQEEERLTDSQMFKHFILNFEKNDERFAQSFAKINFKQTVFEKDSLWVVTDIQQQKSNEEGIIMYQKSPVVSYAKDEDAFYIKVQLTTEFSTSPEVMMDGEKSINFVETYDGLRTWIENGTSSKDTIEFVGLGKKNISTDVLSIVTKLLITQKGNRLFVADETELQGTEFLKFENYYGADTYRIIEENTFPERFVFEKTKGFRPYTTTQKNANGTTETIYSKYDSIGVLKPKVQ